MQDLPADKVGVMWNASPHEDLHDLPVDFLGVVSGVAKKKESSLSSDTLSCGRWVADKKNALIHEKDCNVYAR